ncbi:MAG TPA: glycine C-acetyltransferase [Bryobacterales bacterium]|nr:glycine C-acetyltransferase [Bryobacterales bacterium]
MPDTVTNPLAYLTDELNSLREKGLYQRLRVLQGEQLPVSQFDGRRVINLCSNNYLGLTTHPRLREAAIRATEKYGAGSGAVRTIAGTMSIHIALEEKIAAFKHAEACVVFQSGFAANAGTVAAVLGKEDIIISDELNHASIIDGCRLSRAAIRVFPHKDVKAAAAILAEVAPLPGRKLLITDGVFSMDGDIAPLPALVEAAEKSGAIMMIDDAHASGVLGRNGRGTVDHYGLHGRVHIQVGTLSKAIGVLGGYVCGSRDLIEFLYHRARPFLFSTSHPPGVAASCLAAFEVLEQEPELIERLWENTRFFKKGLTQLGFNTGLSETPITPVMIGDAALAFQFSRELFEAGVFATGIGFPTVPQGKARIRTIMTATHTRAQLDEALGILEKVGKKLRII